MLTMHSAEWDAMLTTALALDDLPQPFRAELLVTRMRTRVRLGLFTDVLNEFEEVRAVAESVEDPQIEVHVWNTRSVALRRKRDMPDALVAAQRALDLAMASDEPNLVADVLHNKGVVEVLLNNVEQAIADTQRAKVIYEQANNLVAVARITNNLGAMHQYWGDVSKGLESMLESAEFCRKLDDQDGQITAYYNLANAWIVLGQYEQAEKPWQKAVTLCRKTGDRNTLASALLIKSGAAHELGQLDEATNLAQRARDALAEIGHTGAMLNAEDRIADLLLAYGKREEAIALWQKTIRLGSENPRLRPSPLPLVGLTVAGDEAMANEAFDVLLPLIYSTLDSLHSIKDGAIFRFLRHSWRAACVMLQRDDERAIELLQKLHERLHVEANQISNPEMRRSYLNNVPGHAEISEYRQIAVQAASSTA